MYTTDWYTGLAMTNAVTVLVSVINIVLRTLNIQLIQRVGLDTQSELTSKIMRSVFITSFINTGIILLMTNADLSFSVLKFIPIINQYSDFGENWYEDIAPSLTQTMFIMGIFPYIEIAIGVAMKLVFRRLDSTDPAYSTKKTTLQQYINLYAGPVYLMHFKYASIMV